MDHRTARRTLLALPLAIALSLPLAACASDEPAGSAVEEAAAGVSTDLDVRPEVPPSDVPAPTELRIEDVVVGDGAEATEGTTAQVKYVGGFYETGQQFDASWDRGEDYTLPVTLGAGQVIPGFEQGIEGMQVGGRRVVTIPSELGYGDQARGEIPAGSTLVFVIDLVSVA